MKPSRADLEMQVRVYKREAMEHWSLAHRLAKGLIDANRLDYPWKDGSRASKALDEAEALCGLKANQEAFEPWVEKMDLERMKP